jgi:hypothetical protein
MVEAQAEAAELSGYAGRFHCFWRAEVKNSLLRYINWSPYFAASSSFALKTIGAIFEKNRTT